MKKFVHPADLICEKVLCDFAATIIREVSIAIKVDPDELSQLITGLSHNHWYIADEFVEGCQYCKRIQHFDRSSITGVSPVPLKVSEITEIRE